MSGNETTVPSPRRPTETYGDAAALLLGLTIQPEWRDGVVLNLDAIAAAAALVEGYTLDDELEAAPIFGA